MQTTPFGVSFAVACLLCLAGCPFTSSTTTPYASSDGNVATVGVVGEVGKKTSQSVDSSGGQVASAGNGATVFVPSGALQSAVTITVAALDAGAFPQPDQLLSHVYDLGPSGTQFSTPTNLSLSLIGALPANTRPVLAYLNDDSAWQVLPGSTYSTGHHVVQAKVDHFTHFAVLAIPTNGSGCADSPDPNAFCSPTTCDANANVCLDLNATFTVGGRIVGLGKKPIALSLNDAKPVSFNGDGNFAFTTRLPWGTDYVVALPQQPNNAVCNIADANGTIAGVAVSSVVVRCLPTVALRGTVTGLEPNGVLLLQSGNETVTVQGVARTFNFSRVLSGNDYAVTVVSMPADQNCTVAGAGTAATTDIALSVACVYTRFALGGKVTGLVGRTQVALTNATDALSAGNGNYSFPTHLAGGDAYSVGITSPVGQSCAFIGSTPGQGTMSGAALSSVNVACTPRTYSVSGVVSGLIANANTTLRDGNEVLATGNGAYTFVTLTPYATDVNLTIAQPAGQTCLFANNSNQLVFNMGAGNVTDADVVCAANTYGVGGSVSGLVANAQVTVSNGRDTFAVGNGAYTLPTQVAFNSNYSVSLVSPSGQNCNFTGHTAATMGAAKVTDVNIACVPQTFVVGGSIAGLSVNTNVALSSGTETLSVTNGHFSFATGIPYNANYSVALNSPAYQKCIFSPTNSNVGIMGAGNVTTVQVFCTPIAYALGGRVSGLVANTSVSLTNHSDVLSVTNGNYTFPTQLIYGADYNVVIASPTGQTCVFDGNVVGNGNMPGTALRTMNVTCSPVGYTLGGLVAGLSTSGNITLQNGNETLSLYNGPYTFANTVAYAGNYNLILRAPSGMVCGLNLNHNGVMGAANITQANISCSPNSFTVGGAVSGLVNSARVTVMNGSDSLSVANGNYTLPTRVAFGSNYNVTLTSPAGQRCAFTGTSNAIMGTASVDNVLIACSNLPYALGGSVAGLANNATVVLTSGSDTVSVTNGTYTFPTSIAYNANYRVTASAPSYQTCAFSPANSNVGVMGAGNVTTVRVVCSPTPYVLGGRVSGLVANANVALRNNSDAISAGNGNYIFPTQLIYDAGYSVLITAPTGQSCVFASNVVGNGNMPGADLKTVNVTCTPLNYTIGGRVSGLSTSGNVTVQNGNETLSLYNGAYAFANPVAFAGNYNLILQAPPGMICGWNINHNGVMGAANIANANVSCSPNSYSISGTVSGLVNSAKVTVMNGSDSLSVANGNYTLPTRVAFGSNYSVTLTSPAGQSCAISGTSAAVMGTANVNNVQIACLPLQYAVGGSVAGLVSNTHVVLTSGSDSISVANGAYTFPTSIVYNANYRVSASSPSYQTCLFSPANSNVGVVGSANVTTVRVVCTPSTYPLGGRISGLVANANVALANNSDHISAGNGNYTFPTQMAYGGNYNVLITPPTGQSCTFGTNVAGNGNMLGAALKTIDVACTPNTYTIGGQVIGLSTSGNVTLQNGNETLSVYNGNYVFANSVAFAGDYNLILNAPVGMSCALSINHNGVMGASNTVANVACSPSSYSIGGSVSGLLNNAKVSIRNGSDTLAAANGSYTLPTKVVFGSSYSVTLASPAGQSCTFSGTTNGVMGTTNVTNINIACSPLSYALGGTVSGLVANTNVTLTSGADTLSVTNGNYIFATSIVYNANYSVALTAPNFQACAFSPANSNVGVMGGGNLTTLRVLCTSPNYVLGGRVTGLLTSTTVTLHNSADTISVSNGNYTFPTLVGGGAHYNVTIASPTGQSCAFGVNVVSNDTMPAAAVKTIDVACTPLRYTLGGVVTGLMSNTNVTLRAGNDNISVTNGSYTFPTDIAYRTSYTAALSAPTGQTCYFSPTNANVGVMGASNVTSANVTCVPIGYTIGGQISNLHGTIQVTNNGNTVTLTSNGNFTIPGLVAYQSTYNVVLSTQPNNQICFLGNGNGNVGAGNVTTVSIICTATYALSGHVSNLLAGGNVMVANANDTVTVLSSSPNFVFPTRFVGNYNVTVTRQPVGQTCAAVSGSGVALQDTTVTLQCNVTLRFNTNQNALAVIPQSDCDKSVSPEPSDASIPEGAKDLHDACRPGVLGIANNQNVHVEVDRLRNRVVIYESLDPTRDRTAVALGQRNFADSHVACSQSGLNAPRSAALTADRRVLVADADNSRVMIWLRMPTEDGQQADVVLGQPDFSTCTQPGHNASTAATLSQPWDVWTDGNHVLVADTYASRVLIWNTFPTISGQPADAVLGQANFFENTAGAGNTSVGGPSGVTSDGTSIFVSEYSYSRVTQWMGVPWADTTPTLQAALGTPDVHTAGCNLDAGVPTLNSACLPTEIAVVGTQLVVTDTGNNRYLVYQSH